MPNITIKKTIHPNATSLRLENKRVSVITTPKKDYQLCFKVLSDNLEPRAIHLVKKNVVTTLKQTNGSNPLCLFIFWSKPSAIVSGWL